MIIWICDSIQWVRLQVNMRLRYRGEVKEEGGREEKKNDFDMHYNGIISLWKILNLVDTVKVNIHNNATHSIS